jgi:beta-glucosidase
MPWIDSVPAVLAAFMAGQEDGHAIASILFGEVNPSGKLPLTFPKTVRAFLCRTAPQALSDQRAHCSLTHSLTLIHHHVHQQQDEQTYLRTKIQYPGIGNETTYSEKLLVGYRWYSIFLFLLLRHTRPTLYVLQPSFSTRLPTFVNVHHLCRYDAVKQDPLFPFGHGLSYTTFKYSNLQVFNRVISLELTNTGSVPGAEVVQVYLEVRVPFHIVIICTRQAAS